MEHKEIATPDVRAEGVSLRCGECDQITEAGTLEGIGDEHTENVICQGCGEQYTVTVTADY